MAETKYGKYIQRSPERPKWSEEGGKTATGEGLHPIKMRTSPPYGLVGEKFLGVNCNFAFACIYVPCVMAAYPHTHPSDEILFFLGGDPEDPMDFQAEVHIAIGEEWEKHVITKTTIVCIPAGLVHSPIIIMKVDKPFVFGHFMLGPTHIMDAPYRRVFLYDG